MEGLRSEYALMVSLDDIVIDDEFAELGTPLTDEERLELQKQIEKHGFRDKLVVWLGHNILLDGHNRFDIKKLYYADDEDREPEIAEYPFPNRDEARDWIIKNQLGRRNLSEEQKAYWRGKLYNSRKQQGKRTDKTSGNGCQKSDTAKQVASETGVSPRTVRNDAKFAETVDKTAPEVKREILSGKSGLTRKHVEQVAEAPPDKQKQVMETVRAGRTKKRKGEKSEPKTSVKPEDDFVKRAERRFAEVSKELSAALKAVKGLAAEDVGSYVPMPLFNRVFREAREALKESVPNTPCPHCQGKRCMLCKETGFFTERAHKEAT